MSIAPEFLPDLDENLDLLPPEIEIPPCDLESNEPPVESNLHLRQTLLLISSVKWLWSDRQDFFASGKWH